MPEEPFPALKELFNVARYRQLADLLGELQRGFDRKHFLALTTTGLDQLSLIQRMRRTTEACRATLPPDFEAAVEVLQRLAPRIEHGFVAVFLPDFIGLYGRSRFDESMAALKFFTPFGSSEFAVREFLKRDLNRTLAIMTRWSQDADPHVRRLASEGSRPRLPWSFRLEPLVRDPAPTRRILENLKADPSPYVRKSVANHLNDISRDNPETMMRWLERWDLENPRTAWIARHAARTLIKSGHAGSFRLLGFAAKPAVKLSGFTITPTRLKIGETLSLSFTLISNHPKPQKLAVDYIVHYRKQNGRLSPKVFKLKETVLSPGASMSLRKSRRLADLSTRTHHAGRHMLEIMVNGKVLARRGFHLAP